MNLDPDTKFLVPVHFGPGSMDMSSILKENVKNMRKRKPFFFYRYKQIMAPEEMFSPLSLTTFALNLSLFTRVDPDPCSYFGTGSTEFLNTDPI